MNEPIIKEEQPSKRIINNVKLEDFLVLMLI